MSILKSSLRAFSLIELLVVVVVIGILAAIVVPNTINAGDSARIAATSEDFQAIERAVEAYRNTNGRWPADVNQATLPPELASYFIKANPFNKTVPVGGVYDYEGATSSRGPRISIRSATGNPGPSDAMATDLDEFMDDGNLESGKLRKAGGVTYYTITRED